MLIIGEVIAMDRRGLLTSIAGLAGAGACAAQNPASEDTGRPPLAIEADGAGRWRIRSWERRGDAWRPVIAHAVRSVAGIEIRGRIQAADRGEVMDRLT